MITHLLVDYGEVISRPQPATILGQLARLGGVTVDLLRHRYWRYRPDYDRGLTSEAYWSSVLGRPLAADEPLLGHLVDTDIGGWLHLDTLTLRILFASLRRGTRLALLSNAPHPQAHAIDHFGWAELFAHRLYSCRLGMAKPEPAIYERALDITGAVPGQTLFIDDKASNTEAAARLGLQTLTYSSPADLARTLTALCPG
ncbi:MAG TPA: HAD family phosphatase [Acidimicrobiales bacterium]|nr:HAD family phosphatase [Acidimicrobiales bacterium]